MEHDAWFFIGVFVFIFIIWIAIGGPLRPIPIETPSFTKPGLFNDSQISLPQAPYDIGNSNVVLKDPMEGISGGSSNYGGGSYAPANPAPLTGVAFGSPSPYRGIVTMSTYVVNASSSNPGSEYIQISVSQNAGAPVNITGWQLVNEATGKSAMVPRGTRIPTSGIVNKTQDIVLYPGERAALISGKSPIGTSFLENKCTGYFSTFQSFSPSLPQHCPVPKDELVQYYGPYYIRDPKCLDYVATLGRCQAVVFPPRDLTKACRSFVLDHLNYNGCVRSHLSDADFTGSGNVWHIYLGSSKHLWRSRHEVIKLLDANRKTVDAFAY